MDGQEHSLVLHEVSYPFRILRRENQKHIYIRITAAGGIIVSAPRGVSLERIRGILRARSAWILEHVQRAEQELQRTDPLKSLYFGGRRYQVRTGASGIQLEKAGEVIYVTENCTGKDPVVLIEAWLREQAKQILPALARTLSRETGILFKRLYLRNQKTRWGSSSTRGNISLNWRIIMAPEEVQRYLIIHELVHQLYQNHSRVYWAKVAEFCPEYRRHAKWLKKHAALNALFRDSDTCR